METIRDDVRQTLRMLVSQKTFTAAALLTLALGIGANAAVFSVVYGVLLRPLPYPDPQRLVRLSESHPGANAPLQGAFLSDLTYNAWLPNTQMLEGVAAYSSRAYSVGRENPERLSGASVSPSLFALLRVQPAAGRYFDDSQAVEGANQVVVLGHAFWQERFGGSPSAIGQVLILDDKPHEIVGVVPPGFAFPDTEDVLWTPYVMPRVQANSDPNQRGIRVFFAIGRLRPGATPAQAAAEGTAAARAVTRPFVAELLFGKGGPVEVHVRSVVDQMTSRLRPALLVLMAGIGLVLLVACANVANLFLARGLARQRELAVRAALGAGRARLARQLLTESLVVSIVGGILGIVVAWGLSRALPVLAPEDFPRLESVQLDWRVLAFAIAASIFTGVLSGVVPAVRGARTSLEPALREGDTRTTSAGGRLRAGLLVAEAAFAVMLIVGAGLLVRSFVRLVNVDTGYDAANVLTAQAILPGASEGAAETQRFLDALLPRLRSMPGVIAAGAGNTAPFGGSTSISGFGLPDADGDGKEELARANSWVVTPGFGEALGVKLRNGRFIQQSDVGAGIQAMVVNEEFVRMYLNDGKPVVGRRYNGLMSDNKKDVTEIVGVVGNVLKDSLDQRPQAEIYMPSGTAGRQITRYVYLLVRTSGDPLALVPDLRALVRESDSRAALDGIGSLASRMSDSVAQPRFAAISLSLFAGLALALAATGLYGVLSYSVSQRRREMGVRAALGATRTDIIRLIVGQGLGVTLIGVVAGLAGAAGVTRLMSSVLFGVTALDAVAFAIAPVVLLVVALAACLIPARRAATTNPSDALRSK